MLVCSGCLSKYETFSNNEGIAHFSFEYPGDMENLDIYRTDKYVAVYFIREIVEDGWFDRDLYVTVYKPPGFKGLSISDAKTLLEDYIILLDEDFKVSKVLERSPVNISEIPGELLVTTWDMMSPRIPLPDGALEGTPHQASLMMISRRAYFDQGGMVWKIQMESTEEVAEETKEDFEHILNTFKIMD
jgi:hypothetical protein